MTSKCLLLRILDTISSLIARQELTSPLLELMASRSVGGKQQGFDAQAWEDMWLRGLCLLFTHHMVQAVVHTAAGQIVEAREPV